MRHADGRELTPGVELVTRHDKDRKAYTVRLYAVTYEQGQGYRLTRAEIRLAGQGPATMATLATVPAARFSAKAADQLHAAWRLRFEAALDAAAGFCVPDGDPALTRAAEWAWEVLA